MIEKISRKTKLGFGAGEFSSSIFFTLTSFWLLNFLTDEVRLSAALVSPNPDPSSWRSSGR